MVIRQTIEHNPAIISAAICVFCIYSGIFKLPTYKPFRSLFAEKEITRVYGKLIANPIKLSMEGKALYRGLLETTIAGTPDGYSSKSCGRIYAYIDATTVEKYYPGKLYTDSIPQSSCIAETGSYMELFGHFSKNGIFYADTVKTKGWGTGIAGSFLRFRSLCRIQFKRLMYSWGAAGGLLLALISGSREYTEKIISDTFKKSGLAYILALSGMHLAIFSGITVFICKRFFSQKILYMIKIATTVCFVWFAGLSPSLLRAVLCSGILLFSSLFAISVPSMLQVLSLSFLVHAMIAPDQLITPAFILSYGALLGILVIGTFLRPYLIRFIPPAAALSISSAIGAQTATAPISLQLFGTIAPCGIIASIIVLPLVICFLYSGLFCILLSFCIPFFSEVLGVFLQKLYNLITITVSIFAQLPEIGYE